VLNWLQSSVLGESEAQIERASRRCFGEAQEVDIMEASEKVFANHKMDANRGEIEAKKINTSQNRDRA